MKSILFLCLAGLAAPALADRLPLPAATPASYTAECGSCHLAYPPALLTAPDWRRLMGGLKNHFGSDAAVDAKTQKDIVVFLERNAGTSSRLGGGSEPPRITGTPWFVREHRKVPARFWSDARVRSAANCEACHGGASTGNYSEHDISIPELRR